MAQRRTAMASDPGDRQARRSGNRGRNRGRNRQPSASINRDLRTEEQMRRNAEKRRRAELELEAQQTMNQGMDIYQGFNPFNPYARAPEQGYVKALEQAQASVMDQFNRTMEPQFARQAQDFQQQMMAQGIDPNSDAYKIRFQEMQRAQNDARQSAMSQAYQLGMENQAQGHTQFMQGLQLPMQAAQAYMPLWQVPTVARYESAENQKNRQAQMAMARTQAGAAVQTARINAQAQADSDYARMMQAYGQGYQGPSAANQFVNSAVGGAGAYVGSQMNR